MNTPFIETPWTLRDIGQMCISRISYKISGFWSNDSLGLYIKRIHGDKPVWSYEVSRSSGGRDESSIPDEYEATLNYAAAMTRAAELILYFRSVEDQLEVLFREYLEEGLLRCAKEKQDKIDALAADPGPTELQATYFVDMLVAEVKSKGWGTVYQEVARRVTGEKINIEANYTKAVSLKWNNRRVGRMDLIQYLMIVASAKSEAFKK